MQSLGFGALLGSATGGALLIAEVAISGSTQIPVEAAVSIGVFVCGCVWWMGRKFQKTDDKLEELSKLMKTRPCIMPGECVIVRKDEENGKRKH